MNAAHTSQRDPAAWVERWAFFSTPLRAFLAVMLPIAMLMGLLAAAPAVPTAIRLTAAAVIAVSLRALWRGYLHRLEAGAEGVAYRAPLGRICIPWSQIRRIGRYTPPDRNRLTQYVYITRLDHPPADRHTIDADTLQIQDRPGLLEALQAGWMQSNANAAPPGSLPSSLHLQ